MAPRTEKNNKTSLTAAETRERAKNTIQKLNKKKEEEETKKAIAKLQAALEKKDDELESEQLNEEMDAMDIDEEDEKGADKGDDKKGDDKKGDDKKGDDKKGDDKKGDDKKGDDKKGDEEKGAEEKGAEEKGAEEKGAEEKGAEEKGKGKDSTSKRKHATVESDEEDIGSKDEDKGKGKFTFKFKKERRDSNSPLFVPQHELESESEEVDSEYGRPLFSRPGPKIGDDVKTAGWAGGRRIQYINRYGPKNAAKHRLENFAESAQYEDLRPESEKVSNVNNRYGDKTLPNGSLQFTKRHIIAVYGVAWEGAGTGDSEADLALIDPDQVEADGRKWPGTYVFIAWDVSGTTEKRWEPRQALRVRWGKKVADKAIFEAACEAEGRYDEVLSGERRATSKSPSVGLAEGTARKFREKSLGAGRPSPSRSPTPRASLSRSKRTTPNPPTKASKSKVSAPTKVQSATIPQGFREQFRADYCERAGVDSFQELDPAEQAAFVKAWQHAKSEWTAVA